MTRTYELRRADHSVVHTSADPIVSRRGAWRTGVSAIFGNTSSAIGQVALIGGIS